jgi:primosomal protein N' (replication factor Y)
VLCEFGRRKVTGVVLALHDAPPEGVDAAKLKPVVAVLDSEPVLPLELLRFLEELARYYLAPIGEVLRLALPAVEREVVRELEGILHAKEVPVAAEARLFLVPILGMLGQKGAGADRGDALDEVELARVPAEEADEQLAERGWVGGERAHCGAQPLDVVVARVRKSLELIRSSAENLDTASLPDPLRDYVQRCFAEVAQ